LLGLLAAIPAAGCRDEAIGTPASGDHVGPPRVTAWSRRWRSRSTAPHRTSPRHCGPATSATCSTSGSPRARESKNRISL